MSDPFDQDRIRREFERRQMQDAKTARRGAGLYLFIGFVVVVGAIVLVLFAGDATVPPGLQLDTAPSPAPQSD